MYLLENDDSRHIINIPTSTWSLIKSTGNRNFYLECWPWSSFVRSLNLFPPDKLKIRSKHFLIDNTVFQEILCQVHGSQLLGKRTFSLKWNNCGHSYFVGRRWWSRRRECKRVLVWVHFCVTTTQVLHKQLLQNQRNYWIVWLLRLYTTINICV
jgi:hypothetical protein